MFFFFKRKTAYEVRISDWSSDVCSSDLLTLLRRLADEAWVRDRVRSPAMVARLWAACGVPDFRKVGVEPHARFAARLFAHLSEGTGPIPHDWFAAEIARPDKDRQSTRLNSRH